MNIVGYILAGLVVVFALLLIIGFVIAALRGKKEDKD